MSNPGLPERYQGLNVVNSAFTAWLSLRKLILVDPRVQKSYNFLYVLNLVVEVKGKFHSVYSLCRSVSLCFRDTHCQRKNYSEPFFQGHKNQRSAIFYHYEIYIHIYYHLLVSHEGNVGSTSSHRS